MQASLPWPVYDGSPLDSPPKSYVIPDTEPWAGIMSLEVEHADSIYFHTSECIHSHRSEEPSRGRSTLHTMFMALQIA